MTPARIIWHHSADSSESDQLGKINLYHKQREFTLSSKGYYVGYHYLIERSGQVVQTREDTEEGCHDAGENFNSIGICLAGNFSVQMPNEAQQLASAALVKVLCDKYKIPITRIEPHRWDDTTECPGTKLEDRWLIKNYLEHEGSNAARVFWWIGEKYNWI